MSNEPETQEHQGGAAIRLERRRHDRETAVRPCKVLHRGVRFFAAETSNVCTGGALLTVERARPIAAGDEIAIAIDSGGGAVVPADSMARARVIRVTPMDHHHQSVAVAYAQAVAGAIAA